MKQAWGAMRVMSWQAVVYLATVLGLGVCSFALAGLDWHGGGNVHIVMDSASTILALIVGAIALMRYYAQKENTYLFISTGFLGAGFLDLLHEIVTNDSLVPLLPSGVAALTPWSWLVSRLFLSSFLFLSWLAWHHERRRGEAVRIGEWPVFAFTVIVLLLTAAFFAVLPLPSAYFPEHFWGRPAELVPATFFALALAGYLQKGVWRLDRFEYWLVLSLIIGLAVQLQAMPMSQSMQDVHIDMAHLFKPISYLCVMVGLLAEMWRVLRNANQRSRDLTGAKIKLDQIHRRLVTSVNSMRNGFAIWDSDDRLVLANRAYLQFHAPIADLITEGLNYSDMLNAGFKKNVWKVKDPSRRAALRRILANRRTERESEVEATLEDGKQLVYANMVLDNGEMITTVVDVSAHRQRELELQDTKDQLEHIAYYDNLTGLANRVHCLKDMAEKFAFADKGKKWAIIQIDLDKFKRINDTQGHATGDYLLKRIGERFQLLTREIAGFEIYRWGGDEFIALVERGENTDLEVICQELTDLAGIQLTYENQVLRPTVSLGVARYPEDGEDLEALMIFADLALYKTKELGRDGYQFFTSDMKAEVDKEARIEDELREAINEGQLELYYQPQINIRTEAITGVEALLRWNHPERGLVSPGEFLPIAENSGLAPAIGRLVFDQGLAAARKMLDANIDFGRLAVNLSPNHLKEGEILKDLFRCVEAYQVAPQYLSVEILESFLLDDPHADIENILKQVRDKDIHVELDDFGTGYASLSHLSTMPISGLKIDRSFIQKVVNDPTQKGIVSSLISISELMKLHVICEGIETRDQVEAISQIGNCSIQGYFVARPMRFSQLTEWISRSCNKGALCALPKMEINRS